MADLAETSLIAVQGQDNLYKLTLTDQASGAVQNLTGKTLTAKVKYTGPLSPLALAIGGGLAIVTAAAGVISVALTAAQIADMPLDGTAYIYLTVWNGDGTQFAHGAFPLVVTLG